MNYNDCASPRDSWHCGDIFGGHSWGWGVAARGRDQGCCYNTQDTPKKELLGPNVTGAELRNPSEFGFTWAAVTRNSGWKRKQQDERVDSWQPQTRAVHVRGECGNNSPSLIGNSPPWPSFYHFFFNKQPKNK